MAAATTMKSDFGQTTLIRCGLDTFMTIGENAVSSSAPKLYKMGYRLVEESPLEVEGIVCCKMFNNSDMGMLGSLSEFH